MEEKNQQEKMAVARQVELFENAFNKAKENGGIWLENDGRKAPRLYLKPLQISAFNAIILGMHSDQNGYKTNQYTLFSEAKKRGESVQTKEKGVPFLWYNWNEYVNKHNPDAAQTIKHCRLISRRITKESETVKYAHFSILSRPHSLWLIKLHLIQ